MAKKEGFNWEEIWEKSKAIVILGLVGLILVSLGIFFFFAFQPKEPAIEILPVEEDVSGGTIFVDLEGAVENPGLYELPSGSRVNDLLIRAGGLSAEADRDWAAKNLNLAQRLSDGIKIYIPSSAELGEGSQELGGGEVAGAGSVVAEKININTASASELDSLWGIGPVRASDIIKNRPYSSIEELLDRKIIPKNVYERIKDEISVY